jgi:uracil-DNA glycosylase family 4
MEYYKKLAEVFKNNFKAINNSKDFWGNGQCDFDCENRETCNADFAKIPIYSGCPGDVNTKIMVIGEAPSDAGKKNGGFICGYFKDVAESGYSPLHIVKEFCQKNYDCIPYFTDYCKCGVNRQVNKADLKLRFKNCFEKFLIKEIEAVKPEIIFALGNSVYRPLMYNLTQIKKAASEKVKIIKLLHYSNRACLPLSAKDKMNIIWKFQAGIKNYNLNDLEFFKHY